MTGFAFAAVLFGVIGVGIILYAITYTPKASPGSGQSRATTSGRDGSHAATRTTATADNPPGPTSIRDPNTRGSTSAS